MLMREDKTRMGHVCILTTAHPTDDVRVSSKITESLLESGYSVSWVGPARAYFASSIEIDPRVSYHLVTASRGRLSRLRMVSKIQRKARTLGPVDWWYSPDPDAAWAANRVARRQGGEVIFDIHETYHGTLLDRWLGGRRWRTPRTLMRLVIARIASRSSVVVGVSRSVLASYAVIGADRSLVVRNCAPIWFSIHVKKSESLADSPMRVVHGKILANNGTGVVLQALEAMSRVDQIQVLMFDVVKADDAFSTSVHDRVDHVGLGRSVDIVTGVAHHDMPTLLAAADVGMIAYGRGLGEDSLPNRLFEYMAAGLAILAPSYSKEICQILEEEQIGITADFDDPVDVARALTWLCEHPAERREMGDKARRAFLDRHSWPQEFDKLLTVMKA